MADFADLVMRVNTRDLARGEQAQDEFARNSEQMEGRTTRATRGISAGFKRMVPAITGALAALGAGVGIAAAIREAEKFQTTMFRVEAVIKATGGAAGRSADQLREQARQLALSTLESTEGVLQAQQTLLTFRKVQGDVFDRAIIAAADMTAALGGDLNSATLQLAKALENPLEGISALSRSGTVFTAAQKDMVRAMVEAGQTAEAQAFILDELEAQYKGTAEAAAGGLAGAQDTLGQAMQELRLELADSLGLLTLATAANNAAAAAVNWLAENIDEARGYIIAAALGLTVYYTPAILAASFQTGVFIAGLITLRGALIATGIGAFVVVAGLLVNKFLELVENAGGFGNALGLLGDVSREAWTRMGAQIASFDLRFRVMVNGLTEISIVWLNGLSYSFAQTMDGISETMNEVFGTDFGSSRSSNMVQDLAGKIRILRDESAGYISEIQRMEVVASAPWASLDALLQASKDAADAIGNADDPTSVVGAMAGASDAADALGAASGGAMAKAKETAEAATDAFQDFARDGIGRAVDWMVDGFKGGLKSIKAMFIDTIKQMIAYAIKNQIMIGLGMGGSVAGSAASAGQGMMGSMGSSVLGAGIGSNLLAAGSAMTGIGTAAFTGSFGAGMGATVAGGMSGMSGAVGAGMAAGGSAGAAMALGAIALPVAAVIATVMFFKKSTKELDNGLKVAIEGMDATAETFRKIQTSRFFGLSKSTSTRSTADPDNPIIGAVNAVQNSIVQAARVLGVGASAFDDFSAEFKVSLKGLTEDQKLAKINEELANMGDEFASLVPGFENMNQVLERAAQISAQVRALTDTQGLFATRQEAVFAASQAGNLTGEVDVTQGLLRDLIKAVREGDVNNGRLTAQLVAIQQRQELAPT